MAFSPLVVATITTFKNIKQGSYLSNDNISLCPLKLLMLTQPIPVLTKLLQLVSTFAAVTFSFYHYHSFVICLIIVIHSHTLYIIHWHLHNFDLLPAVKSVARVSHNVHLCK